MSLEVRRARPRDAAGIRCVFCSVYGGAYVYPEVYDLPTLRRWIAGDEVLVFVAARPGGEVLGTAMLDLCPDGSGDRIGEFGRLCVRAEARGRSLGHRLMGIRVEAARPRLLLGYSETRAAAPASTAVGLRYGFRPAGFLPSKDRFAVRESSILMVRLFGETPEQRRPAPRLIPEVVPVAREALGALGLPDDLRAVEPPPPPPVDRAVTVEAVPDRAPGGSELLEARRGGRAAGRLAWRWSRRHRHGLLRELRAEDPTARHALLEAMVERAGRRGALYLEADVDASDPAVQRTLAGLGFVAGGYLPAAAPGPEGRIDLVRMIRVDPSADPGPLALHPAARRMAELVAGPALPRAREASGPVVGPDTGQERRVIGSVSSR